MLHPTDAAALEARNEQLLRENDRLRALLRTALGLIRSKRDAADKLVAFLDELERCLG